MPSAAKAKREAAKAEKSSQKSHPLKITEIPTNPQGEVPPQVQLIFPSTLTARQRAILHAVGEQYGLPHVSTGEGDDRNLTLGTSKDESSVIDLGKDGGGCGNRTTTNCTAPLADAILICLLEKHLKIDATPIFAEKSQSSIGRNGKFSNKDQAGSSAAPRIGGIITPSKRTDLSQFISSMEALVELERRAEVAAAEESLSSATPEQAQAKGRALLNLRLEGAEGGLLGRTLLTLVRNKLGSSGEETLPPHKFSPHDIVRIRAAKGGGAGDSGSGAGNADGGSNAAGVLAQGVVYRVRETSITVAVDDYPDEGLDVPLKIEKLANEVTYDRLKMALKCLHSVGNDGQGPATPLVDVLFHGREPQFSRAGINRGKTLESEADAAAAVNKKEKWMPFNSNLDESQKAAVDLTLSAVDIALIQGPPGTGKTTTVVEIIMQEVARGSRVLACAASNIAVDNLVERLAAQKLTTSTSSSNRSGSGHGSSNPKGVGGGGKAGNACSKGINIVRVGHPARLLPAVLDSSLEAKVLRSDDSALAKDCRKEIKDLNARILKLGRRDRAERTSIRKELRKLAKEERQRQQKAITAVLNNASVICATLTGVGSRQLEKVPPFDVVVIDEAAQALEPACWAALLRGRRAILAGDHLQLPPTVTSEEAAKKGLSLTLFERAHSLWGGTAAVMLTVQYRMNVSIMNWSSEEMYDGKVTAHNSVAGHTLHDLIFLPLAMGTTSAGRGGGKIAEKESNKDAENNNDYTNDNVLPVLLLIDTAGCEMEEALEDGGESKLNRDEAEVAIAHVQRLLDSGMNPSEIGVITPYAAQVGALRELRSEKLRLPQSGNGGESPQAVEISTVDGFQGREKEAIVISMVRSNTSGEVGFLADNRRMNVAVTRARRQCVIVCDSDTVKNDPFLKRLVEYFEENGEYASAAEARTFDERPATKALICRGLGPPLPEPLDTAVAAFLGDQRCFFWPSPLAPQSVVEAVKISFRFPTMSEPTIDGGFQGLRYLSALLNIAKNSGMLETNTIVESSFLNKKTKSGNDLLEISQPRPGALLIAHPCLPDWFSRTVVLLGDHAPATTTLGLCLNKPWGGDVLDLIAQGRKAGAGNLGLDLSSSSSSGGGGGGGDSNSAFSGSLSRVSASASGAGGGVKEERYVFSGRNKRNESSTDSTSTAPRLRGASFPLRNAIVLNDVTEGSSDYDSSSEMELIEDEDIEYFSSDFSDEDAEGPAQLRLQDLENYLDEKENGITSDEEDNGSLVEGLEDEEEDEEEEQRRERLFEALSLFPNNGPPSFSSSFSSSSSSSSLGGVSNVDASEEGVELVFETDDEETMKLIAAAAHALTEEWDHRTRGGVSEGHIPGNGNKDISDMSVLSKEAMAAIDQLGDGPQKEALMSMLDALGTAHKRVVASAQRQRGEGGTEEGENKGGLILPFALPPPDEEQLAEQLSSVLRIHGGRATFSAGGRRHSIASGGCAGGGGSGDNKDKSTITIDNPYTESSSALITTQSLLPQQQQRPSATITPKELMAMSPRSQVYLGGPLPGVSVLHTRGSALGGKAILGDVSSGNDRVVMFGTDATLPQAAAALAPQDQDYSAEEQQGGVNESGGGAISPEQLRFYLGSSQWAPNQLQQEVLRGSWTMIQLNPSVAADVFEALSGGLGNEGKPTKLNPSEVQAEAWQRILGIISPAHAALAAVPESAWRELQELEI
ncbi:hypothetical protein KSW81_003059 [Nannochloris sp. 'desiccata']|nr:hypothetical protein KSW81_003059 [Chlorella desiccata (nom. nud.)]